jgi:uncharacterized protein
MLAALLLLAAAPEPSDALLRQLIARTALTQVERVDPAWHPEQRDCAGLVRFSYRAAFKQLRPARLGAPLWRDAQGRGVDFADAETLIAGSFAPLGRGEEARESLRSGDLLAFRQVGAAGAPVYHLMLVVRPEDRAHAEPRVVYHPGSKGDPVRVGVLRELINEAPLEWRPVPENESFLGFFRFKEWMR